MTPTTFATTFLPQADAVSHSTGIDPYVLLAQWGKEKLNSLITLKQFIALHDNKYLDFDHVYGAQCVDEVQFYLRDVLGLPPLPGNAINEFGEDAKQLHWTHNNLLELALQPHPGDIMVWGPSARVGTGALGHTAVVVAADAYHFTSFDQNWPVGAPCHLVHHTYDGVIGWGRKIVAPVVVPPVVVPPVVVPPVVPPVVVPPVVPPVVVPPVVVPPVVPPIVVPSYAPASVTEELQQFITWLVKLFGG